MTNLTEQWKKGKLEEYKRYYCKTVWFEDIFMARCHNKGQNDEWWTLENEKYSYNNVHHIKDIEVLAEVPSYEQWIMTKNLSERAHLEMYKARGEKVRLEKENTKLKEILMSARNYLKSYRDLYSKDNEDVMDFIKEIDQVLANNQIQANTVACNKIQEKNNG